MLAALLAAGATTHAQAGPGEEVVMTASGGKQEGSFRYFAQTGGDGRMCWTLHGDGRGNQPPAVAHDGSRLSWRLPDKRRPTTVSVTLRRLAVDGTPVGTAPERLPVTLTPVKSRNRVVAWTATSPEVGFGDLDVVLLATWKGRCGEDQTSQRFHARSLPVPVAR